VSPDLPSFCPEFWRGVGDPKNYLLKDAEGLQNRLLRVGHQRLETELAGVKATLNDVKATLRFISTQLDVLTEHTAPAAATPVRAAADGKAAAGPPQLSWSPKEVAEWILSVKPEFGDAAQFLEKAGVDGSSLLLDVTLQNLISLRINELQAKRIMRAVTELRKLVLATG
jgi:hypothetical protein